MNRITRLMYLAVITTGFIAPTVGATAESAHEPLTLLKTTHLPGIEGDFNVFAVDLAHNRLFVSADRHGTIELFNLKTGEHLKTIGGAKEPHMLAYVAPSNELWIGDAGTSSIVILDGADFHETGRIPMPTAPTAGLYIAPSGTLYIQDDGVDSKLPYSTINVIDVHTRKITGSVRIDDDNLESMAVDPATQRLFVNLRATKKVASVDLSTKSISQIWTVPDLNLNTPMALDGTKNRLFVAGRKPGKFYVLNSSTGAVVFESPCINIADYMVWDPQLKRIYVTGTQGISIFHQIDGDHYEKVAEFPTNGGKISTYVPALQQFYVVHPKTDVDAAGLEVFHVNQ